MWGESDVMRRVRQLIEKVAVTDANVLITGENGTGKEIVAKKFTPSRGEEEVMISVDMGAITETLFESELFGHVKGAFTDARKTVSGNSRRQTRVRCFWMKSETCHTPCNPSYWQPCKSRKVIRWDRINRLTSTSV